MYDDFETGTSYRYLQTVITALEEPICLLGGWGVYFQVNRHFKEAQGKDYIGSRDIDLGFHIKEEWSMEELKRSALGKSVEILENNLGFKSILFRFVKEINRDTGQEIQPGAPTFPHQRFSMSVDPIVDYAHPLFQQTFRFHPIIVPLLRFAFQHHHHSDELTEFDKKLLLPKPELLIATKLLSLPERDKRDKKIKDLCDLFALLWYTGSRPEALKAKVKQFLPEEKIQFGFNSITPEDIQNASSPLNHSAAEIQKVIFS